MNDNWWAFPLTLLDFTIGVVFVVLKTTGIVVWSWFVVLLPFYWPLALILVFLAIAFMAIGVADAIREIEKAAKHGQANSGSVEKDSGKSAR